MQERFRHFSSRSRNRRIVHAVFMIALTASVGAGYLDLHALRYVAVAVWIPAGLLSGVMHVLSLSLLDQFQGCITLGLTSLLLLAGLLSLLVHLF